MKIADSIGKLALNSMTNDSASSKKLNVTTPKDSTSEKVLDKASQVLNLVTSEGTVGTLLAPLSILSGLYSLGRAQNVKGREAGFKAMASAAAVDYIAYSDGRVPVASDFPTTVEAARGQGCLGENAPLCSAFHNSEERSTFNTQYRKAITILRNMSKTPEGKKELKRISREYRQFIKRNPDISPHVYFMK
ncbi:MAG: hypothetical protein JXR95_02860 [Deltaproteobacteria bacterium]|nr:hypothetical protein [Deltaproteobacteria bacterium]